MYRPADQAQMYFARKRRRERAESTSGHGGGLREQNATFGVKMLVALTASAP